MPRMSCSHSSSSLVRAELESELIPRSAFHPARAGAVRGCEHPPQSGRFKWKLRRQVI
jgi:hypothetical protein